MSDYRALRAKAEQVKRKIRAAESITGEELEVLREYAQSNATPDSIGAYAVGKRLLQDSEGGNE